MGTGVTVIVVEIQLSHPGSSFQEVIFPVVFLERVISLLSLVAHCNVSGLDIKTTVKRVGLKEEKPIGLDHSPKVKRLN